MPLAPPPPVNTNPITRLLDDWRAEARVTVPFPPGDTRPSMARTKAFFENPLPVLLDAYERYGPVFTLRIFHGNTVWMLGPEANHYMLVSHAQNFRWRDGHMGDLIPLLGDGLLTIDGEFHRRSRKAMLPAFHRDKIAVATADGHRRGEPARSPSSPRGGSFDLYHWTRRLALRIAMRALFGLDPDGATRGVDVAHAFEEGLGFYARDYFLQTMRGPGTPFWRMQRARRELDDVIFAEITRRRQTGERGDDLLEPPARRDRRGRRAARRPARPRRGHDAAVRRARHDDLDGHVPVLRARPQPRGAGVAAGGDRRGARRRRPAARAPERHRAAAAGDGDRRDAAHVPAGVGRPAPVGRAVHVRRPRGARRRAGQLLVVGEPPHRPRLPRARARSCPSASPPEAKAALPKGAYVPFGGGSRTCIGMRFGQVEVRALAALLLHRRVLDVEHGYALRIRQMPTIGPRDGLPVRIAAA